MICLICKKQFKDITNTHLKLHGLTRSEYRKIDKDFDRFLKQRMSEIAKGKIDIKKGKKYEDVVGKEKAKKWKEKIGKSGIGNTNGFKKGFNPWNKGTKGLYKSNSGSFKKGDVRILGKNNPNWNGGTSFEPYTIDWTNDLKRAIRKRDKYTCAICGIEPATCVHHIDYDKKNCNPNNLITLCRSCHTKTNSNRKYWIKYFNK